MNRHFGRATLCGLAMLAALACFGATQETTQASIPVEDFAQPPALFRVKLSPDGKRLGFLGSFEGRTTIILVDLDTMKSSTSQLGGNRSVNQNAYYYREIADFIWAGNERVIVDTFVPAEGLSSGLAGMNLDSSGWVGLTGALRANSRPAGPRGERLLSRFLQDEIADPTRLLLLEASSSEDSVHPHVVEMNTLTGDYRVLVKNPGDVERWLTDDRGEIRVAIARSGGTLWVRHRTAATTAWKDWGMLPGGEAARLLGVRANKLYLTRPAPASGCWSVYAYPLDAGPEGEEEVWQQQGYDFLPSAVDRDSSDRLVFDPVSGALLGLNYSTAGPQAAWFDARFAAIQRQINEAQPDLIHTILQLDQAGKKALVLTRSARHAGVYSLLNLETMQMRSIAFVRGWFEPENMADMYPIKFTAQDGLELSGYFSVPPGKAPQRLPTVVLVHDGLGLRDQWEFHPVVQFLTSRGYAVLQVNYRGTRGFGERHAAAGRAGLGARMVDDLNEGVRWAVKQQFVDPQRVAIMGTGFGGTCALGAMGRAPDLYHGAIAVGAIADWEAFSQSRAAGDNFAYSIWIDWLPELADPTLRARLNEVAPISAAALIKSPVLLLHSKADVVVPYQQSTALKSALRAAGVKVELLSPDRLGHGYPLGESGVYFLKQVEKFLAANLGGR